ncbi:extracellular catalytic domain type 1 short-chain-length polyhydroxyalkanoate depolymerase [Paenirhodobacter populi]|uniref:PHB depolymerase family esterase n=1 Tax=Paenirhodobacter populi TaxID=2306993 RepID=A0A443JRF8_9RHOB|nr:PHB depolymerase family esterase [Sinirhodobacter populi]RWR23069.1 PHB depolymerase family esterase [Sinirhodobacter populi]
MRAFPSRAWSAAASRLRSAAPSFANGLVIQTLARHGLVLRPAADAAVDSLAAGPLQDMMARLRPHGPRDEDPSEGLPQGARFLEDRFTCEAGTRRYRTYVPASACAGATGMIVMLHGCTQTPEDFAAGTGMNDLAEARGFIVVYPHQSRGENAQSCWNWFRRGDQLRDRGEPAILADLARKVASEHGVPGDRIFVAGLSAGAAMAVILGETYPDVFSGVGAHSGLPAGSAKDVPSAFTAMAGNGSASAPRKGASAVRTIILHGTADATVHPSNGEQIAQRVLDLGPGQTIQIEDCGQAGGRAYSRKTTLSGTESLALVEEWKIEGLGHAWSGGSARGSYTDAQGPDASGAMVAFFFGNARLGS